MSAAVIHFTPKAELGPQSNLERLVALCRQSEVLHARDQFDRNVWDIGYLKGHKKVHRAVFSTLEASSRGLSEPSFPQPFLDFAKATLVYLHDRRPVVSQAVRVTALRCLEAALRESSKGSRPTAVNEDVLDNAVVMAKAQVSSGLAYRVAGQLQLIADFMRSQNLIVTRQRWVHGVKKPPERGSRISKEALTARQEKLPSAATLRALGGIFYESTELSDIVISCYTALMLCAPERINEVLRLRRNCIVEGEGEFLGKTGLRWAGSKGFDNTIKWLPSEMVSIAKEAVENLRESSRPAQKIAAWYTENPNSLFFHEGAAHLRGKEVLTLKDIGELLWGDGSSYQQANTWAQTTVGLSPIPLSGRRIGFRFEDVERAVLAMLPPTFPRMVGAPDLNCEDAVAITRVNELHARRSTYLCMFDGIDYQTITNPLGARAGRKSIFDRFNYAEDDGSPIALRSHSLRHYLNMLAQVGGLSSMEIAIFSGRKDVRQNSAYDHMTSDEVQAPISRALKQGFTAELVEGGGTEHHLIARKDFNGLGLPAAHTTEYGWCVHNFASEPCQMYRDCINCGEQVCIKGEAHKEANLRQLRTETEQLLSEAKNALAEDEYGADLWVIHQSKTLERIDAMLGILGDPSVPTGAEIRLNIDSVPLITEGKAHSIKAAKALRREVLP